MVTSILGSHEFSPSGGMELESGLVCVDSTYCKTTNHKPKIC